MSNSSSSKSNPKRSGARLVAVQALFEIEATRRPYRDVAAEVIARKGSELLDEEVEFEIDAGFVHKIVNAAVSNQIKIDQTTNNVLSQNWKLKKIDPTLRAILRAACGEFLEENTPKKVIVNEYLDITKAFEDKKETVGFMNAVLDRIFTDWENAS